MEKLFSYRHGINGHPRQDLVILSANTGTGKTTELPQMLLDVCDEGGYGSRASIVCLEPRRIATTCMIVSG
jgi:ATP-dependent RNA helicase DHX57